MKHTKKQQYILIAGFVFIMAVSAGVTGYLTARNEPGQAQTESTNSQVTSIDLYESSVSLDTVVLEVGQTLQVNNKSNYSRELSLGSGNAGHSSEQGEEEQAEDHAESQVDTHDHTKGFSSGLFGSDEAWRATFQEPGTYFLHDHTNPEINILIVVYKAK